MQRAIGVDTSAVDNDRGAILVKVNTPAFIPRVVILHPRVSRKLDGAVLVRTDAATGLGLPNRARCFCIISCNCNPVECQAAAVLHVDAAALDVPAARNQTARRYLHGLLGCALLGVVPVIREPRVPLARRKGQARVLVQVDYAAVAGIADPVPVHVDGELLAAVDAHGGLDVPIVLIEVPVLQKDERLALAVGGLEGLNLVRVVGDAAR